MLEYEFNGGLFPVIEIIDAQQKLLMRYRLGGGRSPIGALDFLKKAVRP